MNSSPGFDQAALEFFRPGAIVHRGSAPGRLDFLGGIADYSGSLVLQMTVRPATMVGVAWTEEPGLRLRSLALGDARVSSSDLVDAKGAPHASMSLRESLARDPDNAWTAYIAGCFLLLAQRGQLPLERGADVLVSSDLPAGKGLASSAALEVATLRALAEAGGIAFSIDPASDAGGAGADDGDRGVALAKLAQQVENEIVGAPCGIMDQVAVNLGSRGALLPIYCTPCSVGDPVPLPDDLAVIAVDSGVRHAVSGASYGEVRTAAFMGYSLIARACGVSREQLEQARDTGDGSSIPFSGYLAGISPSQLATQFVHTLPATMSGAEFINAGNVSIDNATRVDPVREYRVRASATHPIRDSFRIGVAHDLLRLLADAKPAPASLRQSVYRRLGEILLQAHASYSACGLGCPETDNIVAIAREIGVEQGVFGARVTGGGSGGTVCLLCRTDFDTTLLEERLDGTGMRILET